MKNFFIVTVVFIISYSNAMSVMGQTSARLSLTECVRLAVQNNPTLKQTELNLYRNQIHYKQAHYNRLPSLDGNIGHGYNEGRSVNATTNQFVNTGYFSGGQSLYFSAPIFNGFEILHDIRRRASAREAGKFEFEGAVNELKLDVIEAYVSVLTAQDVLRQTERQLTVTQENVDRMEIMQREGATDPGDFYDLKGQLRTDQNLLETNRQALYSRELRLAALLNVPVDELPELESLPLVADQATYSSAELLHKAIDVLPQFKALDWRIKEAQQQIEGVKAAYYPSLSFMNSIAPISSLAETLHARLEYGYDEEDIEDLKLGVFTIKRRSEGLLQFAKSYRMINKVDQPNFVAIQLKVLFESIYQLLEPTLLQKNIDLDIILKDTRLILRADINLVEQALINLLLNAMEAVKDCAEPYISIAGLKRDDHVVIKIQDNGRGMSPDIQEQIFTPFFTTKKSGSGVGLTLSKQIMLLHKGNLFVESEEGKGSTFSLQFMS